jgi:hypothetical protein
MALAGAVVLHADPRHRIKALRILRRNIAGMEIVSYYSRADVKDVFAMLDPLHEGIQRFIVLQVADMVAHEGVPRAN